MADVITTVIDLGTPINVTVEANGAEWVAEENRRDNEKSRVQAETVRTENENIRKQAENQRIQNENLRKSKADEIEREYAPRLNAVESGSPKGTYANLQALNTAFPKGNNYTYITLDNGNWNYWDSSTSTWKPGGLYQTVKGEAYNISINDADNNFDADNVEDALKEVAIKNQASNALVGKATGELLNIYTAPAKARKLDILSNTIATPTDPSKPISPDNIAVLESVGEGNLWDGTFIDNTSIDLNGNLQTITHARTTNLIKCLPNTKYAMSGGNRSIVRFLDSSGTLISVKDAWSFTTPVNATHFQLYYSVDGTHTRFMVNYGDTRQPYVPYGCFNVNVCEKNLIDFSDRYVGDEASASRTARVFGDTAYTLSYNLKRNDVITPNQKLYQGWYKILDIRGNIITQNRITYAEYDKIGVSGVDVTKTLTMPSNAYYLVVIFGAYFTNTVANTWYISSVQLELGSTATSRTPYIGQEYTVPLKDTQGNFIPSRGLENVQDRIFKDIDGLRKVRGNIGKAVFDGSSDEGWYLHTSATTETLRFVVTFQEVKGNPSPTTANLFCDKFETENGYSTNKESVFINEIKLLSVYIKKTRLATLDVVGFKTWLQSHPLEVLYETANPTITTLHQDAQNVLNQIEKLKDGQTVIYGTDKVAPSFEVEYAKDINKVITDLTNAIISLGGNV